MKIKRVVQKVLIGMVLQSFTISVVAATQVNDQVGFEVPQFGVRATGFKTSANQMRVDALEANSSVQLKISGGQFKTTAEAAKKYCSAMGKLLGKSKKLNPTVYKLSTLMYPFNDTALASAPYTIENRPQFEGVRISVGRNENAFSSSGDINAFRDLLEQKVETQMSSIQTNGVFSLDVVQVDDVICDLVLGNVVLKLEIGYRLQPAKPEIQSVLTETEFAKIYEDVRLKASPAEDLIDRVTWDSSVLTRSLTSLLGLSVEDMGERRFVDLFGVIFDRKKGQLRLYSPDQYATAIHSIDRKKYFERHDVLAQEVETQVVVK